MEKWVNTLLIFLGFVIGFFIVFVATAGDWGVAIGLIVGIIYIEIRFRKVLEYFKKIR